jgi:hypothetical protein
MMISSRISTKAAQKHAQQKHFLMFLLAKNGNKGDAIKTAILIETTCMIARITNTVGGTLIVQNQRKQPYCIRGALNAINLRLRCTNYNR